MIRYDAVGDILYIDARAPSAQQSSEELGDNVVARLNPRTHEIETLEVLFFQARGGRLELPVAADLRSELGA